MKPIAENAFSSQYKVPLSAENRVANQAQSSRFKQHLEAESEYLDRRPLADSGHGPHEDALANPSFQVAMASGSEYRYIVTDATFSNPSLSPLALAGGGHSLDGNAGSAASFTDSQVMHTQETFSSSALVAAMQCLPKSISASETGYLAYKATDIESPAALLLKNARVRRNGDHVDIVISDESLLGSDHQFVAEAIADLMNLQGIKIDNLSINGRHYVADGVAVLGAQTNSRKG